MATAIPDQLDPLLARALAGDAAALNRLLEAVRPLLCAVPRRTVPDVVRAKLDTSDLIQDSLLEAARAFPRFQGQTAAELLAWLRTIVRNNARDERRRYRREKADVAREVPLDGLPVAGADERPSRIAADNESDAALWAALARLGEDDRRVIELRQLQNLDYAAVAAAMGRSELAVRRLLARAMIRWKKAAERGQETPPPTPPRSGEGR